MSECVELFIPPDWREAAGIADLACGHGALATALGIGAWQAMTLLSDKEGWINQPQMEGALGRSGRRWRRLRPQERFGAAAGGVVMVQWLGAWMEAGNPFAACAYRHWAAYRNVEGQGWVWDVNEPGRWMRKGEWVRWMTAALMPERAVGWDVIGKWEVEGNDENRMRNDGLL